MLVIQDNLVELDEKLLSMGCQVKEKLTNQSFIVETRESSLRTLLG